DDVAEARATGFEHGCTVGQGLSSLLLDGQPGELAGRRIDADHAGHIDARTNLDALRVERGAGRRVGSEDFSGHLTSFPTGKLPADARAGACRWAAVPR